MCAGTHDETYVTGADQWKNDYMYMYNALTFLNDIGCGIPSDMRLDQTTVYSGSYTFKTTCSGQQKIKSIKLTGDSSGTSELRINGAAPSSEKNSWVVPASGNCGDLVTFVPSVTSGYGCAYISAMSVQLCDLSISSFDSNRTVFDPNVDGQIVLSGSISGAGNDPITWSLDIAGQTFSGSGRAPSVTWNGKDNNGKALPEGLYTAILSAKIADGSCTDSKNVQVEIKSSCSLKIAALLGESQLIDPFSGGVINLSSIIDDNSGKPIEWTLTVAGKIYSGSGKSVSVPWDGKDSSDKIVEPGNYFATIIAKTGDGLCTDTKKINFTVVPPPDGQCGLYVDFGSSAHMASGNLTNSQVLFSSPSVPAAGMTLYYNSLDRKNGPMGQGWSHSYDMSLKENADGSVLIGEANWRYRFFTFTGGAYSGYTSNSGELTKNDDGSFTLSRKDGLKYSFVNGRLAVIADRNGNTTTINYVGGNLSTVSDQSGKAITFTHDGDNRLISITDPGGNIFGMSVAGSLHSVTQPDGGVWRYTYDPDGFMLTKTDPLGNITTYGYDDKHRVISAIDPEGRTRNISYPQTSDTIKTTTFTEKDGGAWIYRYDTQKGYLLAKTDPQGGVTSYTYDSNGNRIANTYPDGTTTAAAYDNTGNMLTSTDALKQTTTYMYNSFGQVLSVTDPAGNTSSYAYDAKGNMTSSTDPSGATTGYDYDTKGNTVKITDPTGHTTSFAYDTKGNLTTVTDPAGAVTGYAYDPSGNMTGITDATGTVTSFVYDKRNRLVKTIDPYGNVTTYTYDLIGNMTSATDAEGNARKHEYNSRNRIIKTIDALNNATSYAYGGSSCPSCGGGNGEKLTSLTDAAGNTTRYLYDQSGRLMQETDSLGNVTSYVHDAKGNLTSKTDGNGNTVTYRYDGNGRLLRKLYPDETEESFTYGAKGNILTAANKNISYSFSYDAAGRMISATDSSGKTIGYAYDLRGNKTGMTMPDGTSITYGYDGVNRLTSIVSDGTYSFSYDANGRRTGLGYPNGDSATYAYDAGGRLTNLVRKNQAGAIVSRSGYALDKVGNRLSRETPDTTTSYQYDAIYRLLQALSSTPGYSGNTTSKGDGIPNATQQQKEFYAYDPVGNRLSSHKTKSYVYNQGNQLTANGGTYRYDKNGNLIQKASSTGITTYDWDYENRLVKVVMPDGTTAEFAYDPFGRRIQKKTIQGGTADITRYVYDNQSIVLEYDGSGAIVNKYLHGPHVDEPLAITTGKTTYYYHADGLGSIVALTDQSGKVVQTYEYDSFGNLKDQMNRFKQPFMYTGREWDKETGLYYYRARYYDSMVGRFLSKDPIGFGGGVNFYGYVRNNPISFVDPFGKDSLLFNGTLVYWVDNSGSVTSTYSGISGPFGKGSLPPGYYTASNFRERTKKGMVCPDGGWSLDLTPQFKTDREYLRIHPDQSPVGTEGCIGIACKDSGRFYDDLMYYFDHEYDAINVIVNYDGKF